MSDATDSFRFGDSSDFYVVLLPGFFWRMEPICKMPVVLLEVDMRELTSVLTLECLRVMPLDFFGWYSILNCFFVFVPS